MKVEEYLSKRCLDLEAQNKELSNKVKKLEKGLDTTSNALRVVLHANHGWSKKRDAKKAQLEEVKKLMDIKVDGGEGCHYIHATQFVWEMDKDDYDLVVDFFGLDEKEAKSNANQDKLLKAIFGDKKPQPKVETRKEEK